VFFFVLILFFAAFSLTAGLLITTLLNFKKNRDRVLSDASLVLVSVILIQLAYAVKVYGGVSAGVWEPYSPVFTTAFTMLGFALFAFSLPVLAHRLVKLRITPFRWTLNGILIVILTGLGVLKDTADISSAPALEAAAFALAHVYAAAVIIVFFKRIEDAVVRSVVKTFLFLLAASTALTAAQVPVLNLLAVPARWREVPYGQLIFIICASTLIVFFTASYFYKPDAAADRDLPVDFVSRFGISQRECDIIALVMQGFSHKQIGGRLFISNRTVKNHIYNIYQKTGAANKVQLLNLIHSDRK
jgi:DNA-binding CsgD family transcriptional regulator